jgi:hypothetical protein
MTEQTPMPDGWIGQEATITHLARNDTRSVNRTIREVNDRGVGVEEGQRTSFFPWTSIVRIDLGVTRRGSRSLRAH